MATRRLGIIGGGISGLSAQFFAHDSGKFDTVLFEQSARCGGWIQQHHVDGLGQFAHGPRSLRSAAPDGPTTLALIRRLGLDKELLWADATAKRRLLYTGGRIVRLGALSSSLTWRLVLEAARDALGRSPARPLADESIHDFFARRFGSTTAEVVVASVVQGIFANDPRRLSIRGCFPQLADFEDRHGSVVRGIIAAARAPAAQQDQQADGGIFSLRGGLSALVDRLQALAPAHSLRTSTEIVSIQRSQHGVTLVQRDGRREEVSHVLSSLRLEQLLAVAPELQSLRPLLPVTRYSSVAVVNLAFRIDADALVDPVPESLQSFGYLVPPKERDPLLGVIFDTFAFPSQQDSPPSDLLRLTAMLGGDAGLHENSVDVASSSVSDQQLAELALQRLRTHLPDFADLQPCHVHVTRCINGIPCYDVGYPQRRQAFEDALAATGMPVSLIGPLWGVGVGSCISRSAKVIDRLVTSLPQQ